MPRSVLDAIKMGLWDYEPPEVPSDEFDGSNCMPGTKGKLGDLAERVRCGLPLWHPDDREELDEIIQPREKAPAESEALRLLKPR